MSVSGPALVSSGLGIGVNWPAGNNGTHASLSAMNPHLPLPSNLLINHNNPNFMPMLGGHSAGTTPRYSGQFSSNDTTLLAASLDSVPTPPDLESYVGYNSFGNNNKQIMESAMAANW
jgi:hypothetical protein